MQNPIQDAFDSIRADGHLIERTRQKLLQPGGPSNLAVRLATARRRQAVWNRRLAAAACVCLLAGVVAVGLMIAESPVAAVSLDLDQSVTLQINRLGRVISVSVYPDGKAAGQAAGEPAGAPAGQTLAFGLSAGELRQKPLEAAVAQLIAAAAAQAESIDASGATIITLATSADAHDRQVALSRQAEAAATQALATAGREAVIYMEFSGYERVQEARALQMTPGRLNLIRKLIELEPGARIEDCAALSNRAIMQRLAEWVPDDAIDNRSGNGTPGRSDDPDKRISGQTDPQNGQASGQGAAGDASGQPDQAGSGSATGGDAGKDGNSALAGGAGNNANSTSNGNNANSGSGSLEKADDRADDNESGGSAKGNGSGSGNSGNGNENGNENGSGKGDSKGNDTGNGNGSGLKNASGNSGNGRPGGPKVDTAALQRIRQALARSAANASRNASRNAGARKAA